MAKIKESDIISVTATYYFGNGKRYPISWSVMAKLPVGRRTFASYGKDPTAYPYPVEKLPKAVQTFIGSRKPSSMMHVDGDMQLVRYNA